MICLKHRFAFRLATTSFIYPADWATNVRRLSPWVDEVELLFFESHPHSLPSAAQIVELTALSEDLDLTYNVHLPIDLDLTSDCGKGRNGTIERMAAIIRHCGPLKPTSFTLHLDCAQNTRTSSQIAAWQAQCTGGLARLLDFSAVEADKICVETLNYPPQWLAPPVKAAGVSMCLDVGHIVRYGYDLEKTIDHFGKQIRLLHLHGVINGQDHDSLAGLDGVTRDILIPYLKEFSGSVSIEVFSADKLDTSLIVLEQMLPA